MAQVTLSEVKAIKAGSKDPTIHRLCEAIERLHSRLTNRLTDPKYALIAVYGDGYTECYADEGVNVRYVLFPANTDRLDDINEPIIKGLPKVYQPLIDYTNPVATSNAKGCPTRSSMALTAIYRDSFEALDQVKELCK